MISIEFAIIKIIQLEFLNRSDFLSKKKIFWINYIKSSDKARFRHASNIHREDEIHWSNLQKKNKKNETHAVSNCLEATGPTIFLNRKDIKKLWHVNFILFFMFKTFILSVVIFKI